MDGVRTLVAFLMLVVLTGVAYACDEDCNGPASSTATEACRLKAEATALERVIAGKLVKLQASYAPGDEAVPLLQAAQVAWQNHRDAYCLFEASERGGQHGISWHRCNVMLLHERERYLAELLSVRVP